MARRPRVFAPGLLYHVIARGNQQQATFLDARDGDEYVARLARYRRRYEVTVYAYCLMPNHVHLLVQTSQVPLARFMQGLQQSYTQWFNRVHDKVGHLFQGRYRAIICENDRYLAALVRYIELNAVRAGLVADPAAYHLSSHREYLESRATGRGVVERDWLLRVIGGRTAYRRFVTAGIGVRDAIADERLHDNQGGAEPTIAQPSGRPRPSRSASKLGMPSRPSLTAALGTVARRLAVSIGDLAGPGRAAPLIVARAVTAYVLVREMGFGVNEVAGALARDPSTVSVVLSGLERRATQEPDVAAMIAKAAMP